jgi:hypothetical protein
MVVTMKDVIFLGVVPWGVATTDVSEKGVTIIFKVERIRKLVTASYW